MLTLNKDNQLKKAALTIFPEKKDVTSKTVMFKLTTV
jgi:hypothetical protein